ncbi:DUF4382 domain-containing protein [Kangiella sediminilitoris]|uniref:Putative lipoprotein n=1 Tax=Kangiella sediminilitoris TaxID=1144748 RepID=A0A1B3B809_9GAMM|nr:DUF4382 domain-containing protein [Kangiella sediminilitoris]AOE48931.1 Putative lipoprotein [Kangiella sediminilitoris]
MKTILKTSLIVAGVALALTACRDDDPDNGKLSVAVTDAPIDDAEAVVVQFTGIEIQGPGGQQSFDFDTAKTIDLLQLTGDESLELLPETELTAGQYQWMRLKVNAERGVTDSYIDINSARYSLFIPSGSETGLKLNRPFVIAAGGITDLTVDFDLRKSVHEPQDAAQDYYLRPTLRVVDNLEVGHITGMVDANLIDAEGCTDSSAVYLFDGADAETDDVDANEPEPITTGLVEVNNNGDYVYEIGFVVAGEYTLGFTCEAANDDPETDDVINFTTQNVTVNANETVTVDF